MTAREFSALISAVLITVGTIWYIVAALKGTKVKPVLASWIILGGHDDFVVCHLLDKSEAQFDKQCFKCSECD